MAEFDESTPYDVFAAVRTRLLNRQAEPKTVSQLGQAVSDALDKGCTDRDVQLMIGDLEAQRERAAAGDLNGPWELPLAGLLGVLRQTQHNRRVMAASLNPGDEILRDKVLMAIDIGTNTPAAIAALLHAPTTVVSLVMHQLTDDGLIEPAEPAEGQRQRPYRRVEGSTWDAEQNADTGRADTEGTAGATPVANYYDTKTGEHRTVGGVRPSKQPEGTGSAETESGAAAEAPASGEDDDTEDRGETTEGGTATP